MLTVEDQVSHQRWLLDNGFVNDLHKDNLYMYGAIVHKDVLAVQVDIDITKKTVSYDIYVDKVLMKKISKFHKLVTSKSIISMWRLRNLLRKEGDLNFDKLLQKFVKDYCGPKWSTTVKVRNVDEYEEGFEQQETGSSPQADQPADSR